MMKLSKNGLNLIKKFEGVRLKAYKDSGGIWTIGYGHTGKVTEGLTITQAHADDLLKKDIERFEDAVNKYVKVELNQNQFDALVSFTYNVGAGSLQRSTLLKLVNAKNFTEAAKEFDIWIRAKGKVLAGLVDRRNEEQKLFLKPVKTTTKPPSKHKQKTVDQLAQEVLDGDHGTGNHRKRNLGDRFEEVQKRVNDILIEKPSKGTKSIDQLVEEVIEGIHGSGRERMLSLGDKYEEVQEEVNRRMKNQ